jgi:predicted acetyltransferase
MGVDDLESVGHVRAIGFGGDKKRAADQIKNNPRYDTSHIIVAEYEGQIIGTATIIPAKMWLSGVPLSVGAVAAVTVLPEFQRNGVAGKLMKYAVIHMHGEGQTLSMLFPFSHKYYRKLGFGTISDLHAYYISPSNLSISEEGDQVRPFAPDDLPIIRVLYKGRLTWSNGWFTRSNEWWDKIINQWPNIMVYDDGDMVGGYYSYEIKAGHEGRWILQIKEFFAADAKAFRGLMSYLATQNEADVIEYLAPADTPLRHCLRQPIAANAQNRGWIFNDLCHITPGPVARIINLPQALTTRFYTRGMSGTRILKVKDPLIPANEALTVFRLVDGRAETHPADDHKPDIETDIVTLTQILCGYMKATDAYRLGYFKSDEDTCSWLDKIIADTPLFIQAGDWF